MIELMDMGFTVTQMVGNLKAIGKMIPKKDMVIYKIK